MPLRPELQAIFDEIMAAYPEGLGLDELSEALLRKPVTYADIDEIIGALEEAGVDLEGPAATSEELRQVLAAAREIARETGRRASAEEIAERAGLSPAAVRRALRLGRSAGDPTASK
jgi:hypothetical protein